MIDKNGFCVTACGLPEITCEVEREMTGARKTRKLRCVTMEAVPLRSLLLALFLLLGILAGYVLSGRCSDGAAGELRRYFDRYLASRHAAALSTEAVLRTLVCFLRAPVAAFLLGFASIGVLGLPLLFAAQGLTLSFSLFSFAGAMGRGAFLLLPALFAIRLLFVLPCTFLLGDAALEKSRDLAILSRFGGKRARPVVYGAAYWYRFAVCCVCLLIGSALELWLVPLFLSAAA